MMARTAKRHPNGYSLLEMLAYVAVFAVGVNLCMSLFVTGTRLSAITTQRLDRMNGLVEIQQAFRERVRGAEAVAEGVGEYRTDPTHLVLRCPGKDGESRYVILGALRDANHLSVLEVSERNGVLSPEKWFAYALPVTGLSFEQTAPGLLEMNFEIKKEVGERDKSVVVHRCIAAVRGIALSGGAVREGASL